MDKFAIINEGRVENIVLSEVALKENWVQVNGEVNIGDTYLDGEIIPRKANTQEAYDFKKEEVENTASLLFSEQVEVDGILWRGGQNSAQSIINAVDLTELLGGTSIELRDAQRKPHTYTLEDAKNVAAKIGTDYLKKWQAEEDALLALAAINLNDPDALAQINAITLEI